jgi:hypothetical protein
MLAAILAGLAVLTAASSASAMYHPTVGKWVMRDRLGYSDGVNLYEYGRGRVLIGTDPVGETADIKTEGNEQDKKKPCYCCCIKDIRIENLKSQDFKAAFGHSFDVTVTYEYVKADKAISNPDCQLAWHENANRLSGPGSVLGAKPNEWNDMYKLASWSTMFHGWNSRLKQPGEEMTRTIPDAPVITGDSAKRVLYFAIRVDSAKGCPCTIISMETYATQTLEPDGKGGVKTQSFDFDVPEEERKTLPPLPMD